MVVDIAVAVAQVLHQPRRRIEDVFRRHQRAGLPGRPPGRAVRPVGGVGLGRGAQIDDALDQGQLALGRAQALVGLPGGDRMGKRVGLGEADVLDGEAHQPPGDVAGILAARHHAGEPIERRVGIGPAQRLVQGADQVEVAVLVLVVERQALLHRLHQPRPVEERLGRQLREGLDHVQKIAPVAVGHGAQGGTARGVEGQVPAVRLFGPLRQHLQRLVVETLEHQHLATG